MRRALPSVIISLVFIAVGALLILYPRTIRRYDQQLVRYIKDENNYVSYVKLLGLLFVIFGGFVLILALMRQLFAA